MFWANNIPMTEEEERQVKLVQAAGCKCSNYPLLGYIPGQGPRCRLCNIEAIDPNPELANKIYEQKE